MHRLASTVFVAGLGLTVAACHEREPALLSLNCTPKGLIQRGDEVVLELECGGALHYGKNFFTKKPEEVIRLVGWKEPLRCVSFGPLNAELECPIPPGARAPKEQ